MPLYTTPDGRYTYAIETPGEGDGNSVVYDNWIVPGQMTPVWNRWAYEAGLGVTGPPVLPPSVSPPAAEPAPPSPEPAAARVIQVTTQQDGDFVPRMYSYWPNAWITGRTAYVFAGHVDGRSRFFKVDLSTGGVERLGTLIGFTGTTEGWYWDAESWIYLIEGTRLMRVNPFTNDTRVVFDIADEHPGCILWQAHSSDDGQTHAATIKRVVQDGAYPAIGTVVFRKGHQEYFPAYGDLDESQIDTSGRWLIIKENDDNRIIDLETRETRMIRDADGAVGHSDCGDGILVGEDNIHGACVLWDLRGPLVPSRRREVLSTWNLGHISIRGGRCLRSYDGGLSLIRLDGSGEVPLVSMSVPNDYDHQLKANLDPSGRVACYMVDTGGRFDVFLLVL